MFNVVIFKKAVKKVISFGFLPLCSFVNYFVILCGSRFFLPQSYTKVDTKVH